MRLMMKVWLLSSILLHFESFLECGKVIKRVLYHIVILTMSHSVKQW